MTDEQQQELSRLQSAILSIEAQTDGIERMFSSGENGIPLIPLVPGECAAVFKAIADVYRARIAALGAV